MKPKAVLYNPRSSPSRKRILPMSILALGAVLEERYDYSIVDGNVTAEPLREIRELVLQGANVLAVTVMPGPQLSEAFPHCVVLKREFPELIVIWGGYFPTLHAEACLRSSAVDYVVRGYGERVLVALLDALERKHDGHEIAGVATRISGGAVIENPMAPMPHPDHLPEYPYHRIDMARYVRSTCLGSRTLPHHSSYGCPFLCNFCAVVNLGNGRWLAQSASRVAAIAELYVMKWQVNAIEFHDNNFFTQEARVAEIAALIAPFRVAWWGEARIDTLLQYSDATWQAMRDSGLKMVYMGAETASLQTLQRMAKGGALTPDKTLAIAERTRRYGIVPEFSFLVGNPPDPDGDLNATIDFIRRLKKVNPASEIILYNYSPVPVAGELYDLAQASGFCFPDTLEEWISDGWKEFSGRRHARTPWLRKQLPCRIRNFERVLNAYYPTSTDPRLTTGMRALLRAASTWRYHARVYAFPLELRLLQRLIRYQRPETSGF